MAEYTDDCFLVPGPVRMNQDCLDAMSNPVITARGSEFRDIMAELNLEDLENFWTFFDWGLTFIRLRDEKHVLRFLAFSHNHAAPLTPLESPKLALLSTVETSSEKIYSPQIFGTFE